MSPEEADHVIKLIGVAIVVGLALGWAAIRLPFRWRLAIVLAAEFQMTALLALAIRPVWIRRKG